MKADDIETAMLAIVERAEYAGRQAGIAMATRSSRRAKAAWENADLSSKVARHEVRALAERLASK